MAQLAFFSMVASLSLAASAWLSLSGLPSQTPMTIAAIASAALFGAVCAACRWRAQQGKPRRARQQTPAAVGFRQDQDLVGVH